MSAHPVGRLRGFRILAAEAIQDAVRRRVVAAIAAMAVLSLLGVDGCTSCASGSIVVNGEARELPQVAGATGLVTFTVLSLWCVALAGILASDHLVETLDDGSALLSLARPVGRGSFAAARLSGVLAITFTTGAVLLGATAALLHRRSELALEPALGGALAFAVAAATIAALTMTLSLFLPRIANVLAVFALIAAVTVGNVLSLAGREPEGLLGVLDRFGPPLASSLVLSLSGWIPELELAGDPAAIALRALVWAGAAGTALGLVFGRIELARRAP